MLRMVRASTSLRVDVSGVTFLVLDDATIA
jgi:hypothetical protein